MMVEPDLAELVDENGDVGQFPRAQQALQQSRLAAAEKAGDDVDRRELAITCHVARAQPWRFASALRYFSSSGSHVRPPIRSAAVQISPTVSTIAVRPVRLVSK